MKSQRLTVAEIRASHPEAKRRWDKANPWGHYVQRPLSFYVAWLFLRMGISANATTGMSFIAGVVGCAFLALGGYRWAIIGAVMIYIYNLLDVADGTIARYTKSESRFGYYLDSLNDSIIAILMPIAIGVSLYLHPDPYLGYLTRLLTGTPIDNNVVYLAIGVSHSLLGAIRFLVSEGFGLSFAVVPSDHYKPGRQSESNLWKLTYAVGTLIVRLKTPVLLVFAILNSLSLFLVLYAIVTCGELIAVAVRTLTLARTMDTTV